MPIILKKFALYLEKNMNLSTKTVKSYIEDILLFFSFLKYHFNLDIEVEEFNVFVLKEIREDTIYSFLIYLNYYKNNTASSRNRRLSAIKHFYKYLYLHYPTFKHLQNPIKNINTPINVIRLPKCLNFEQAKLIQEIFNYKNSKNPERNNAIITLFLHTGIRISELINLSLEDIKFDKKEAKITAKGNVERIIFLNDYTIDKLTKYLKTRTDDCEALFVSNYKKRLSLNSVERICKQAFNLIDIDNTSKYSAHTLRHTSASIMYNKSHDLLLTKEFLGHASISSTEIYAHIHDIDIKNAVDCNPLNTL